MIKIISKLLILALLLEVPAIGLPEPKILEGKEVVWSGEVELSSDVIVPQGTTLKIMPGCKIYGSYEYENYTFAPEVWQIIIEGDLIALGETEKSIVFDPIPSGLSSIKIPIDPQIENITIAPKNIDTEKIRDEFRAFRMHYVVLWVLLFGSIYYAIETNNN